MSYTLEATDYPGDETAADTGHLIAVLEEVADTNAEFRANPDWVQPGDRPITVQAMLGMADGLTTDGGIPHPEYRDMLVQIAAVAVAGVMLWDQSQPGESGEVVCPIAAVGGRGCEQPDCTCQDQEGGAS